MGTRGTLKVYLDGRMVINQYNQWDSYPTGQFMDICRFMASKHNRMMLRYALGHTAFLNRDAYLKSRQDNYNDLPGNWIAPLMSARNLCNRDIGANILYLLTYSPALCEVPSEILANDAPDSVYHVLVDWKDVFEEPLSNEEGNYTIWMYSDSPDHFDITGVYHDALVRNFHSVLPTKSEIEDWEDEGDH